MEGAERRTHDSFKLYPSQQIAPQAASRSPAGLNAKDSAVPKPLIVSSSTPVAVRMRRIFLEEALVATWVQIFAIAKTKIQKT